jgi:C4-dicarboxylate-specific signal transduction histidine kinase
MISAGNARHASAPRRALRKTKAYVVAAIAVALATAITRLLNAIAPECPNTFFMFAAVAIVAWFLDAGPGWFAAILSAAAVYLVFMAPMGDPIFEYDNIAWIVTFCLCATTAGALGRRRRATREMLAAARADLERRVDERTKRLSDAFDRVETEMAERFRVEGALREARHEVMRASHFASAAELTASIAHEINQPLSAVVADSEAALNWLGRDPPLLPQARASIAAVLEAGQRAAEVLDRIRSLIVRGQCEVRPVDVNDLIRNVMLLWGAELERRDVTCECHYGSDLPAISGDRVQLQQLVLNLISNAVEAIDGIEGGSRVITITTSRNTLDQVRIVVEDNGQGLTEVDTSRLFEPFYTTKEHGMGMGLSICRTIVEAHGGSIRAEHGSRGGARFEVELPAAGDA